MDSALDIANAWVILRDYHRSFQIVLEKFDDEVISTTLTGLLD